jgi:predicted dehydrogenase
MESSPPRGLSSTGKCAGDDIGRIVQRRRLTVIRRLPLDVGKTVLGRLGAQVLQHGAHRLREKDLGDSAACDGVSWRFSRGASGHGALGDLGSHHIDLARFLVAEVAEVAALTKTWTRDPAGAVTDINDDAFIAVGTLANGATATFQASRAATAHSLTSLIEIDGTKGSLSWGMERLNELTLREPGKGPRVLPVLQPGHPFDGFWLPGGIQGSHPLGWNECFAHQAHDILALASGKKTQSLAATFEDGYRVAEIVDTIEAAAQSGTRQTIKFRP